MGSNHKQNPKARIIHSASQFVASPIYQRFAFWWRLKVFNGSGIQLLLSISLKIFAAPMNLVMMRVWNETNSDAGYQTFIICDISKHLVLLKCFYSRKVAQHCSPRLELTVRRFRPTEECARATSKWSRLLIPGNEIRRSTGKIVDHVLAHQNNYGKTDLFVHWSSSILMLHAIKKL